MSGHEALNWLGDGFRLRESALVQASVGRINMG